MKEFFIQVAVCVVSFLLILFAIMSITGRIENAILTERLSAVRTLAEHRAYDEYSYWAIVDMLDGEEKED